MTQAIFLSEHFSWAEANVTSKKGVNNTVPLKYYPSVQHTAARMEAVRALLKTPILVSSWFRGRELNTLVGGAPNSQHTTGEAVDFTSPDFGSPLDTVRKIALNVATIDFDQLILEPGWVHISFNSAPAAKQRNEILTLIKSSVHGRKRYVMGITNEQGVQL